MTRNARRSLRTRPNKALTPVISVDRAAPAQASTKRKTLVAAKLSAVAVVVIAAGFIIAMLGDGFRATTLDASSTPGK